MKTVLAQAIAKLGVYRYPYASGGHHTASRLATIRPGDKVAIYEQEFYHETDGWVWALLADFSGFVPKRHRFAEVEYLIWCEDL